LLSYIFLHGSAAYIQRGPASTASFDAMRHLRRGDVTLTHLDSIFIRLSKTLQRHCQAASVVLLSKPGTPACPVQVILALRRAHLIMLFSDPWPLLHSRLSCRFQSSRPITPRLQMPWSLMLLRTPMIHQSPSVFLIVFSVM
jgi:hypothetical protein